MSLKLRIVVIFLFSIVISVLIFIVTTVFLLKSVLWGGEINENSMKGTADKMISEILTQDAFNSEKAGLILSDQTGRKYKAAKGMGFDLLDANMQVIFSTTGHSGKYSLEKLLARLSNHGTWNQQEWVIVREIRQAGFLKGYLSVSVPKEDYQALTITLNSRGSGLLGKIFFIGIAITLIVSSILVILLTYRISIRFSNLTEEISRFELGNLDVYIKDSGRDELGRLAYIFNKMAANIKRQVTREKILQEERQVLVSSISHDLRTPLTSIVGYSEALETESSNCNVEMVKCAGIIKKNALHMEHLLDDLLYFLKHESGNYKIQKSPYDLAELCREIIIDYIPAIKEKGMELDTDIPDEPVEAPIDVGSFTRVLRNIVENALKYGSEGKYLGITVKKATNFARISISDHGPGIPNEYKDKVFDRFFRSDKSRNSKISGFGLGLSISKDIVNCHGGNLSVESECGHETKFTIELPL